MPPPRGWRRDSCLRFGSSSSPWNNAPSPPSATSALPPPPGPHSSATSRCCTIAWRASKTSCARRARRVAAMRQQAVQLQAARLRASRPKAAAGPIGTAGTASLALPALPAMRRTAGGNVMADSGGQCRPRRQPSRGGRGARAKRTAERKCPPAAQERQRQRAPPALWAGQLAERLAD